ncbi:hypothetical protein [Stenotrophomonas sp. Marseille-Q4652]|uniref:hypothetical protein n=1 Tax=Stenotrophomonas sp. Marseille-Q4652 TaxID=2866595 RepID=UPI001CE44C14|nr:hypothetical protein [Stenotrophomonas sp. Marseille-Q4652]
MQPALASSIGWQKRCAVLRICIIDHASGIALRQNSWTTVEGVRVPNSNVYAVSFLRAAHWLPAWCRQTETAYFPMFFAWAAYALPVVHPVEGAQA